MIPQQSPLFIPAHWQGNGFEILDETLLPWKVEYLTARDVSEAIRVVREMKTRAFGQVLTFFYSAVFVAREDAGNDLAALRLRLKQLADEFARARPTFDFGGLGRLLESWLDEAPSGAHPGKWLENRIHEHVSKIPQTRIARARRAAELLPDSCRLLTHCNISGEVAAIAQCGKEMGKKIHVIATETRPYLQGSRLTAWEVAQAGIPVTLIPDCAVAQVIDKGEVDAVVVGADRVARNGDVINKVGTFPIALVASKYRIPFYALVQNPGALSRGADAVIEERPVSELLTFQGRPLLPQETGAIQGRYPAFDVTPAELISTLINFDGTFTPEAFREKYGHPRSPGANGKNEREKFLLVHGIPKKSDYAYLSQALKAENCRSLLIPEMRPELWGVHIVVPELARRKLPVTVISDNMMGTLFAQGQIQRLYLFYAGLGEKGPVGLCGSLLAALLAQAHGIGAELLSSEEVKHTPLDRDVATFLGQRVCPEGVAVYPIEKETIPWSLFKAGAEKRS